MTIDLPVDAVWRFMMDRGNVPKWTGKEIQYASQGPLEVGSAFRVRGKFLGRQVAYEARIAELEPNKRFTVEWTTASVRGSKDSFLMESVDGGKTRLVQVGELRLRGFLKILAPLAARSNRRLMSENVARVKRLAENLGWPEDR